MKSIKPRSVKLVMGLRKRMRGFTLIEVVLVIAIGLGIVVGGLVFYQQAHDRAELTSRITVASQIQAYLPKFARENLDMARHQGHWKTAVSRLNAGMTHILPGWEVTNNSGNAFEAVFKGVKVSFSTQTVPGFIFQVEESADCVRFRDSFLATGLLDENLWSVTDRCSRGSGRSVTFSYEGVSL